MAILEFLLLGGGAGCVGTAVTAGFMRHRGVDDVPEADTLWKVGAIGAVLLLIGITIR